MLQKFKISYYAFILCLFGLTLITVSPVLAEDSAAFVECQQIKGDKKAKKNCFKKLARELESSTADAIQAKDARIAELESSNADAIQAKDRKIAKLESSTANAIKEKDARIMELEGKIEKNEGILTLRQTQLDGLIPDERKVTSRVVEILASHPQLTHAIDWCKEHLDEGNCTDGPLHVLLEQGLSCVENCGQDCNETICK